MSFAAAARIGAAVNGAKMKNVDTSAIAAIAESVVAKIRGTDEETLRSLLRDSLLGGRHPDWFEGELNVDDSQHSLMAAVNLFWDIGLRPVPKRRLRLLQGGAEPTHGRRRARKLRLVQGGAP
jgi:hypothetical protein